MKKLLAVLLVGAIMSTMAFGGIFGNKKGKKMIQLKGSDTILNLGQKVSEEFMKQNDVKVAVTGGGSGTGIAALFNYTVDIAQASRSMKSKEWKKSKNEGLQVKELTVAYDGITVVINKNNGVSNLTMEQIRSIFIGEIKNWKELGGIDKEIIVLSRDSSSGTHGFFKSSVLRRGKKTSEEYRNDALFLPSNQAIVDETVKSDGAIGYIGMGYMNDSIKAVSVDGIAATVANVAAKKYPISRGLYWYVSGEPKGNIKKLVDFMFSDEGQAIVKEEGFVSIR